MGRHPLQTGGQIRHEIGKLPKSVVDHIPLVIYIPPPPEEIAASLAAKSGVKLPEAAYSYPPKAPNTPHISDTRRRFRFIRRLGSSFRGKEGSTEKTDKEDSTNNETDLEKGNTTLKIPQTWEEHWEKGDYPFVVLEGNRAACAICLMDFEEPKKIGGANGDSTSAEPANISAATVVGETADKSVEDDKDELTPVTTVADTSASPSDITVVPIDPPNITGPIVTVETSDGDLKLADAGEGVQPLRLLECGHVFHVRPFSYSPAAPR
jgi:hypothetical protein